MNTERIPKVELHRHLEMSFRLETFFELAPALNIELPKDFNKFSKLLVMDSPLSNLEEVLEKFMLPRAFWSSEELIERLTFEAIEDAHKNENIRVLELRYAPSFIQSAHQSLSYEQIHQSIIKGIARAKELPIAVGVIGIIQRTLALDEAQRVMNFIIDNKESFIGVDLADNEVGSDYENFRPLFNEARNADLRITVHSGEANVTGAGYFVKDAIETLGAERIGHGLMIAHTPEVIEFVKQKKIPLELCVTSNWLTSAVREISDHPIKVLMDQGVRTTINTDDPTTFGVDLNKEYDLLVKNFGFSEEDFIRCNRWAFEASFVPDKNRFAKDFL